jgi:hypothetical protein
MHQNEWRKLNPRCVKNYKLWNNFAITIDQYEQWDEALAVDHNHISGLVRGLLCRNCNNGLGQFKDNIETLEKAITYLKLASEIEKEVEDAINQIGKQESLPA